ncbi:MAG: hypothetical protein OXC19_14525 [Bryobacterales bacterium]|nr:hypothetical protein [Bryobacterales bacterium]
MAAGAPGVGPVRAVAEAGWLPVAPDWRRLYWTERERAEAAEERAAELKRAELAARSEAGGWRWQFESARRKRRGGGVGRRRPARGAEVRAGKIRELYLALMKEREDTAALRRLLHESRRIRRR